MARKVDPNRLGKGAPKVTQDDLEDDVAVVTIASYDEDVIEEGDDSERPLSFLTFEELGDKRLYLNKTQATTLIEKLGDDADEWVGQQVPIEKTTAKFGSKKFEKVTVVVDPDEWADYIEPPKPARAPARRTRKTKRAKRGRR